LEGDGSCHAEENYLKAFPLPLDRQRCSRIKTDKLSARSRSQDITRENVVYMDVNIRSCKRFAIFKQWKFKDDKT